MKSSRFPPINPASPLNKQEKLLKEKPVVTKYTYGGLFLVSLTTLMYEILLTRIFSVTMWYHFAFFAVSVAMFGMTVGAIWIYLFPNYFTQEKANYHLALSSLLFAVSVPFSFLTHLSIPFVSVGSIVAFYSIGLNYVAISIPFVFSGMCVCIALTKFPAAVSKLYAADLGGAAIGCILLIYVLNLTDGPTAVLVVALCASLGSLLFAVQKNFVKLTRATMWVSVFLALSVATNAILVIKETPVFRVLWLKGKLEEAPPLYEKWNSFSYVRVFGNPNTPSLPIGAGFGSSYPSEQRVKQLILDIDARALTPLTMFTGDKKELAFLKYDIANLVHYLRQNAAVLVIGTGGGRDILSALAFDQKSVLGVEINKNIIEAVTGRFGDFTGHLDRNPKVTFANDEARSYIARQKARFDIIQVSLIDTWAATAAGAFVLTENSLYTVEAWKTFLEHLTQTGILTFSRWYFRDQPGELYRVTSLARESLREVGVENPRNHIMIVIKTWKNEKQDTADGIGTILISKEPFSAADISTMEQISQKIGFDIILSPSFSSDPTLTTIASEKDLTTFYQQFPINIAPPTDNSPFFFRMLRLRDAFNPELWHQGETSFNMKAVFTLGALLIVVVCLTLLCVIIPLNRTIDRSLLKGAMPLLIFFVCIGFGYMLVEISQMQRLIIFLGHPTYGLSVVLFSLLLSSGLGSYTTQRVGSAIHPASGLVRLFLLLSVLAAFGVITPYIIRIFEGSTTVIRIFVAAAMLFPIGLFMGMPFPLGMEIAAVKSPSITPWLWGINGAASVCASVFAVAIALSASIPAAFWTGFGWYLIALIALLRATQARVSSYV